MEELSTPAVGRGLIGTVVGNSKIGARPGAIQGGVGMGS